MFKPQVSVVMSVYNGERYLHEAIESILKQTFKDFEFLIINDGSNDSTKAIIDSYKDTRIKVINNKKNIGLTRSLNKGLRQARGEYIARQDADDISLPQRLEKQAEFLSGNPRAAIVGSWTEVIDEYDKVRGIWHSIPQPHLLRWRLLFSNQFTHCAIMFRRSAVMKIGGYLETLASAQDYDLWSRISFSWEVANIPEILVKWRKWEKNISTLNRHKQLETAKQISKKNLEYILDETINEFVFESYRQFYYLSNETLIFGHIKILTFYLKKLIYKFLEKYGYSKRDIVRDLKEEVSSQLLFLLEDNAYDIGYKIIFPLLWLTKLNHTIPLKQTLRILLKSLAGRKIFAAITN